MLLHLRVFGDATEMDRVVAVVSALPGADHVTRAAAGDAAGRVLVTADVDLDAANAALEALRGLGISPDDVWLLRLDGLQPSWRQRTRSPVFWADLLGQAGQNARPVGRYTVFMAVAGIIAAYGVIYANGILIVGAMAVSPDFLPIAATCVGLFTRRARLAAGGFVTLVAGLGVAGLVAGVLAATLDLVGLLPAGFDIAKNGLPGLTTVNSGTFVVALAAGIAGMLAVETRASAAVGVAISVTTIPASAYLGVAAGLREANEAAGALAVLAINVAMLTIGGTLTLSIQEALNRRAPRRADP